MSLHSASVLNSLLLLSLIALLSFGCEKPPESKKDPVAAAAASAPKSNAIIKPAGPVFFDLKDPKGTHRVTLSKASVGGEFELLLTPGGGFKVNDKYPIAFTLKDKTHYASDAFKVSEKEGKLNIKGKQLNALDGKFSFSVCTSETCNVHNIEIMTGNGAPPAGH